MRRPQPSGGRYSVRSVVFVSPSVACYCPSQKP